MTNAEAIIAIQNAYIAYTGDHLDEAIAETIAEVFFEKEVPVCVPFNKLPNGTAFRFIDHKDPSDIWIALETFDSGLIAQYMPIENPAVDRRSRQSMCCFKDDEHPMDTLVEVVPLGRARVETFPQGWKLIGKKTCYVLQRDGQAVATLAGTEAHEDALSIAKTIQGERDARHYLERIIFAYFRNNCGENVFNLMTEARTNLKMEGKVV